MDDIEYWFGNPSIEVYKGTLQLCQELTGRFCIIDIPTCLILSDLLSFLHKFFPHINDLKIFKSSSSKVYCCAVSLTDPNYSKSFLEEFSDKKFNEIEDHICSVVCISNWIQKWLEISPKPFERCPICLDDIDKPTISILCGHDFHVKCLEMWSDTTCPVCRYHQTPPDTSVCDTCGEEVDVRMCLICGELGCPTHSQQHYLSTSHTYFQAIETSITWDYSRQVSISRLIASNQKLVEIQDGKKIESIMFEYNCLLSSLLETQKEFYEEKIKEIEVSSEDTRAVQISQLEKENILMKKKIEEENELIREIDELNSQVREMLKVKQELTEENEGLSKKAKQRKVFKADKEVLDEIRDLETQIKEMNFYMDTQEKLRDVDVESVEIRQKK